MSEFNLTGAWTVSIAIDSRRVGGDADGMTPKTCRAARTLLEIGQIELAEAAGVSAQTVRNYESGTVTPSLATWQKIKRTLERRGVQFIDPNGGGEGVRLRRKSDD